MRWRKMGLSSIRTTLLSVARLAAGPSRQSSTAVGPDAQLARVSSATLSFSDDSTPPRRAKRLLDVAVASTMLAASSPVQLFFLALHWLEDGKPLFFVQPRAGRHGEPISVLKMRTMYVNTLPPISMGRVSRHHFLVTNTGRVARRYKIDELPQLLSVIGGQMSLVGPRPALLEQAANYDHVERRRLQAYPGLTGWAQVNGGTLLEPNDRIALDIWYVDNWTFRLDLLILVRTIFSLLRGERIRTHAVTAARSYVEHLTVSAS